MILRCLSFSDVKLLSGGELQRFAIGLVCVQKADVYMFEYGFIHCNEPKSLADHSNHSEPSSFLDVKQRLNAGRIIRSLLSPDDYVIVVEVITNRGHSAACSFIQILNLLTA